MMTTAQQDSAMDDMADHGCLAKARADLAKAEAKVKSYERSVAAGEVAHDPAARCYKQLKDAQMVLEFVRRSAARKFDHEAENQALAGRVAINLRTGEVSA